MVIRSIACWACALCKIPVAKATGESVDTVVATCEVRPGSE